MEQFLYVKLICFGLVSFFNGISTFVVYFKAKAILPEQLWWYLTHSLEDKEVHTFPKRICQKVNVIVRPEVELAYYNSPGHPNKLFRM